MNHPAALGGRAAEAMLLESGERYRQLIEVAPVGIFVHCDWRVVLANPAMAELFRARSVDDLLGREVLDLVSPVSRELVRERIGQLYETPQKVPLAEVDYVRLDGSHFSAEVTAVSFRDAGRPFAHVVARDITDRKNAERALRASEQRFRALVELSSDWFWEQDAELRFVLTSGRSPFRGGISEFDHIGKRRWELPNTEILGQTWQDHRAVLAARASFHDLLVRRTTAGGTYYIHVSGEPRYDEAGNFCGYRGVAKDVTERYQVEEALREVQSRLRVTLDAAPGAIYFYDRNERIITANQGYAGLMEKRLEEIVGRSIREAAGEQAYSMAKPYIDRALAGEATVYERRRPRADGLARDLQIHNVPHRDDSGRVIGACALIVDVTEFKDTQRRLEASEARFRALTGLSADWYWEQDENLRFVDFSPDVESATGSSVKSHLGKTRWDLPWVGVPPEQWAEHRAVVEARLPFRDFEYQRHNERGELIWVSASGLPIFDSEGRFRGYRGIGSNITARKRAEGALRETSAQYRTLVNSIEGIVWEADPATFAFTFVSGQAERLLGYPLRQWLDEPDFWRTHTHPEDAGWAAEFCLRATAELRDHEFEYRMIAADGRTVWLRDLVSVVTEQGAVVKLRGIMVDITERKNAEHALRVSEERFRHLTTLSSDFYWETDREHRFTMVEHGASFIGPIPKADYLGRTRWEIPYVSPDEDGWRHYREIVAARGCIRGFRFSRRAPDGEIRSLEVDGDPLQDAQGVFSGYRGVGRDVTDRLRAESALRESEQRVRALLHRLTSTLEAERRRIAADLHDVVGQNLSALGLGLETLTADLSEASRGRPTVDELARLIRETMDALRQTISDLRPSLLDDYGLRAALESHCRTVARRSGLRVSVEGQPLAVRLAANAELALFRIAQEALANAVRHACASQVRIVLAEQQRRIRVSVEDDGIGLAQSAGPAPTRLGGWGLAMMRERAEAAGGALHVEFLRKGTRIVAEVPCVDPHHPG